MNLETQLLKALLSHQFYSDTKPRIQAKLFEDEAHDIYDIIREAHTNYPDKDLTEHDLMALWMDRNPVHTSAELRAMKGFISDITDAPDLTSEVAATVITRIWQREIGRMIGNLGIEISEGNDNNAMARLNTLLERTKDGFLPDDFGEGTTKDITELLAIVSDENRYKFNIETLCRVVYGIGRGEFGIVFAAPNTGKSAFMVSICAGPGGFCEQGARVLYLGNEEDTRRTMLRAVQAWTGMTRDQIRAQPQLASTRFMGIRDRLDMKDCQEWDLDQIEAYLDKMKPDIVVIDQGDKVHINGTFNAGHEKLRELYRRFREMAKKYDCALIAVSQASAEVNGKTRLSPHQMEGSKVGKFAEADLIIGIGKNESNGAEDDDPMRYLTIGKNKLSGYHGTIPCNIEAQISRYTV